MRRNIKIAKSAGFCFGVRRAVSIAEELGRSGKKTVTLGPIIHNAHVVGYLRDLGIKSVENAEQIPRAIPRLSGRTVRRSRFLTN